MNDLADRGRLSHSASTTITVVLNMDVDRVLEVSTKLFRFFLSECVPRNNYVAQVRLYIESVDSYGQFRLTFECLLDVDGFLSTCLKVRDIALGVAEGSCPLA